MVLLGGGGSLLSHGVPLDHSGGDRAAGSRMKWEWIRAGDSLEEHIHPQKAILVGSFIPQKQHFRGIWDSSRTGILEVSLHRQKSPSLWKF